MDNTVRSYNCKPCNKSYSSYKSLWNHNKKFHNNSVVLCGTSEVVCGTTNKKYKCTSCNKYFNDRSNKYKHEKICKVKINEIARLKAEIEQLKNTKSNTNNHESFNTRLIDIISNKNKKIEELINNKVENQQIIQKDISSIESLKLNNVVITSRSEDNYINATQLCQAGSKKFSHWYSLDITKQLINELASDAGIPASQLIDVKKGNSNEIIQGSWIHPDLAIQLAQWLSPKFAIQVSRWIRQLFTNGKVETKLQLANDKIKLLENTYLKKHKRDNYPNKNVIYMLTTEHNLKNRTYIIGKTKNLKNRLSVYNKTCDHQVIYYKECSNEDTLNLIELMVLNKLKQYQEKANRDRFILPIENNISLFINVIEDCIKFIK
jgi:hypothetical protein